jgi:choline dehydrogenase-like flavoprotein
MSTLTESSLEELERETWDAIIVGTGMGGATLGYALAKAGKRVLWCEKGKSLLSDEGPIRGVFAETRFPHEVAPSAEHREILLNAGRYAEEICDETTARVRRYVPFIGLGTGGSSAIYGAALERFFPSDFVPREKHSNHDGSTLPEVWPIDYETLKPYYEAAERLYGVRGTVDPLRKEPRPDYLQEPPPLTPASQELYSHLQDNGLHPYRLPQGCRYVDGCQGCQGFLCPKDCKNDSNRVCLRPAMEHFGAELRDECEVTRLEARQDVVTSVVCRHRDQEVHLRGKVVVLAANALETPRILLKSTSHEWPRGLANDSGMVGRNLMRHFVDLYAIRPRHSKVTSPNLKELAFNDFYRTSDQTFGTVQSFGALPPAPVVVAGLDQELKDSGWRWLRPLFRAAKPVLKRAVSGMLGGRVILASIVEDLPYADNQVGLSADSSISMRYRLHPAEKARIASFRKELKAVLKPFRFSLFKQAENNERIAHACGTCRMGDDPKASVINADGRAHHLANLYIVDASFFPSSGGTNPGLTIAANALRVAERICLERQQR